MQDQTGRFSAQYLDTLDLYKKEFGADPPENIWGLTKFDKEQQRKENYQSGKKNRSNDGADVYSGEGPLFTWFEAEPAESYPKFTEFGGGDFGGGGAGSDWSDSGDGGGGGDSGGGGCSGGCGGGGD